MKVYFFVMGEEGVGDAMEGRRGNMERRGEASPWRGAEVSGRDGDDNTMVGRCDVAAPGGWLAVRGE